MNSSKEGITDEDFTELLVQPADGDAASEAAALRSALRSYRAETLQWAERRSSTQPSLQPAARRSRVWAAVPQWSLAAVAVISIAAGVAHVYDRADDSADQALATTHGAVTEVSVTRTSDADIAADNRLLSSIDQALSYHAPSPVEDPDAKPTHRNKPATAGVID